MNNSLSTPVLAALAGFAMFAFVACGGEDPDVRVRAVPTTSTPQANVTSAPDDSTPESDEPEPVELPFRPANPVSGGLSVAEYLAGGLADIEGCVPELVADWELEPIEGDRCLFGDIDNDDQDELIYLVSVPGEPASPGDVWFFDDAQSDYRLFTSARAVANEVLAGVSIEALIDLTGDGAPEAVVSHQNCDGDLCTTGFVIASAHRGFEVENLAPDDLSVPSTEGLTFDDATGDQLTDLLIRRESGGSDPAAGPQRASTLIVTWTGLRFRLEEEADVPEFLFHLVTDADDEYRSGDLAAASELYLRAAGDQSLRDWKREQGQRAGREELQPYSLFRAALAAQRSGNLAGALELLERAFNDHKSSAMGLAAGQYLQALQEGQSAGAACAATEEFLEGISVFYVGIWDYGYANPAHPIDALCR